MKLDTRDKKPKLYSLAILSAAAVLALAWLAANRGGALLGWGNLVLALYFGAIDAGQEEGSEP